MNPLAIFDKDSKFMSYLRALVIILTGIVALVMSTPILATNSTVLKVLLWINAAVQVLTKFTPLGNQLPPPPPPAAP